MQIYTNILMCAKFQKDQPKTVGVALTRKQDSNGYLKCSNYNICKSGQARVMILEFCKSSHSVLHLCEVS